MTPPSPSDKGLREEVALLPCPFCGEADALTVWERPRHGQNVLCKACNAAGPFVRITGDPEEAAIAWNRRPALSREGWRWVPEEPTREMWEASGNAVNELGHRFRLKRHHDRYSEAVWKAMLSASPLPSGREEKQEVSSTRPGPQPVAQARTVPRSLDQGEGDAAAPEPPWPIGSLNNAKRTGWAAFFAGRGRDKCSFPPIRRDLKAAYEEGWDAASNFSLTGSASPGRPTK